MVGMAENDLKPTKVQRKTIAQDYYKILQGSLSLLEVKCKEMSNDSIILHSSKT